jgi:hypothetical protein
MARPEFARHMHLRVAHVVNYAVKQKLNIKSQQGATTSIAYSKILGQELTRIWRDLHSPVSKDSNGKRRKPILEACANGIYPFHHISMTKAVLYINSLGVRWNVLQSSPEYNLRVPLYLCGFTNRQQKTENAYNKAIFSTDSTHLLYAVCKSSNTPRLLIRLPDNDKHIPSGRSHKGPYPFSVIMLPFLQAKGRNIATLINTSFDKKKWEKEANRDLNKRHTYLEKKIFEGGGVVSTNIGEELNRVLPASSITSSFQKFPLLYVYNLYKLHHEMQRSQHKFPVNHFVYLPDLSCPGLAPAGFAGTLYCEGPEPTQLVEYGRLIYLMQLFFSNFFQQPVTTIEADKIQVALDQGIRTDQTWVGMYTSLSKHKDILLKDVPLLGSLKNPAGGGNSSYDKTIKKLLDCIDKRFIKKAWPVEAKRVANGQVGFWRPNRVASIDKELASPEFGYHALARHAFSTIKGLWVEFGIIDEKEYDDVSRKWGKHFRGQREEPKESSSLLFLVEHLLFFEPTLHYIKSYRDHFMHSFNVLLLGYWFLSLQDKTTNTYFLFPKLTALERESLLKCWTVTAPLHDIAYPLEKLNAGAKTLMKRFCKGGAENFDINMNPDWWPPLTQANAFRFFQKTLRDVMEEKSEGQPKYPFFRWHKSQERKKSKASSAELATMLISLLLPDGNHGVTGALLLHNNFHEPKMFRKKVTEICRKHDFSKKIFPDEQKKICTAIAFHHICDSWKSRMKDKKKKRLGLVDFSIESHHNELCYLLLLCDTLGQWGRNRVYDGLDKTQFSLAKEEEEVECYLRSLKFNGQKVTIEYDYPNVFHYNKKTASEKKDVKYLKRYFDQPFELLTQGKTKRIYVKLRGKDPDGKYMYDKKDKPVKSPLCF